MITKKTPKTPKKYFCEKCDFVSKNKKDYERHLSTDKHKMITNDNKKTPKTPKMTEHICNFCEKKYKFKSGLSRHLKNCVVQNNILFKNQAKLLEKNNELLEQISKQKQEPTIKNIITNNITIQMYLDDNYKNALSFDDFIENLKVSIGDLIKTQETGYINGISNVIIKNLDSMDISMRPIHRDQDHEENFYIKTDSNWKTDDGNTVSKAIEASRRKHFDLISEGMINNHELTNGLKTEECMNLIKKFTTNSTDDEKIIENIGNAVKLKV